MISLRRLARCVCLLNISLTIAACNDDAAQLGDPWALSEPLTDIVAPPGRAPRACAACAFEVTTGRLPDNITYELGVGPHAADGQLVWKSVVRGERGEELGEAINAQVPGEAPRRLIYEPGTSYQLLDARGANMLYWAVRGDQARLIARFGEREVVMFEGPPPALYDNRGSDGVARPMISDSHAAAVVRLSDVAGMQLVSVSADGRRAQYELPQGALTQPSVRGAEVVLSARVAGELGMDTILWVRELGAQPREVGLQPTRSQYSPVIVGEDVLWVREGAVVRGDLMATREEVILPGPCGPLNADNGNAVVACGPGVSPLVNHWAHGAVELYRIGAGQAPRRIYKAPNGHQIVTARVSGDRAAWLEYPIGEHFCRTPGQAPAEVMVLAWDAAGAVKVGPQALGPKVDETCLCCGAARPAFTLSFAGDLITWRYDIASEGGELGLGWAKLGGVSCGDVACGE